MSFLFWRSMPSRCCFRCRRTLRNIWRQNGCWSFWTISSGRPRKACRWTPYSENSLEGAVSTYEKNHKNLRIHSDGDRHHLPAGSGADHGWRCNLEYKFAHIRRSHIDHCADSDRGMSGCAGIYAAVDQREDRRLRIRWYIKNVFVKKYTMYTIDCVYFRFYLCYKVL